MRIIKTEEELNQYKINIDLDNENYKRVIKEIIRIGKKGEENSNTSKLKYHIAMRSVRIPYMKVKGWTSRCEDLQHVYFSDYDNILWWILKQELEMLIKKYDLPPFYVFTTSESVDEFGEVYGNYLVINLAKNPFWKVCEIQSGTHADPGHKMIPRVYRFKSWVLRLGEKGKKPSPQFKEIVGKTDREYEQEISNAHLKVLETLYPEIPRIKYKNVDCFEKIFMSEYVTASK